MPGACWLSKLQPAAVLVATFAFCSQDDAPVGFLVFAGTADLSTFKISFLFIPCKGKRDEDVK